MGEPRPSKYITKIEFNESLPVETARLIVHTLSPTK